MYSGISDALDLVQQLSRRNQIWHTTKDLQDEKRGQILDQRHGVREINHQKYRLKYKISKCAVGSRKTVDEFKKEKYHFVFKNIYSLLLHHCLDTNYHRFEAGIFILRLPTTLKVVTEKY